MITIFGPTDEEYFLHWVFHSFRSFPFFTVCFLFTELDAVLRHLGHGVTPPGSNILDTSATSADESEASRPRRRVRSKRAYKMKKMWEQLKWIGSSSLELQMRRTNLANSIVAPPAKTSRCWQIAHMKSWGSIKLSNFLPVTSDWDWRHLVGGYWILRETPSVTMSWSATESAFFEVLWSLGIESIRLPKIWLLMILQPRMPHYHALPRCRLKLKCCDWAALTIWFTKYGHSSPWLPAVWTLTWHGPVMRC